MLWVLVVLHRAAAIASIRIGAASINNAIGSAYYSRLRTHKVRTAVWEIEARTMSKFHTALFGLLLTTWAVSAQNCNIGYRRDCGAGGTSEVRKIP